MALVLATASPTAALAAGKPRQPSADQLVRLCEKSRSESNYQLLDRLSSQLIASAEQSDNRRALAYGWFYRGTSLIFNGHGAKALQWLDRSWTLSRQLPNDSIGALVMNARGIYQAMYQNNSFLAQRYFFRSIKMAERANYDNLKIRVYGNLLVLSAANADVAGLNYARRIYNYGRSHHDFEQQYMGAYYIAIYYKLKGNYAQAKAYIDIALKLYKQHPYDDIASVYILYSEVRMLEGRYPEAEALARRAVELATEQQQVSLLPEAHLQLAKCFNRMGRPAESNAEAEQALRISAQYQLENKEVDCRRLMADNDIALGHKDEAIANLLRANKGMDTLSSVNMTRLMHERSIMDSIQLKDEQVEFRREQVADQRRAMVALGLLAVVLLVLLVVLVVNYRMRNRLIKRIVEQNVNAIERHKQDLLRIAELEGKLDQLSGQSTADTAEPTTTPPDEGAQTKSSSQLLADDDRKSQLYDRICRLMEDKELYKESQLTRDKLAAMLDTNRTYLSAVIHEKSGMSYQQFINSYRINEAVRILSDRNNLSYPIKQLWSDLGFNSRSTFYSVFQQTVGITPSVYRKQFLEIKSK